MNSLADSEKEKKEHMKVTSTLNLYIHASDISLRRKKRDHANLNKSLNRYIHVSDTEMRRK